jgi:hypothetical protein
MPMTAEDIIALKMALKAGFTTIETEIVGEKASSLGQQGRAVETAMDALRAFDAAGGDREERLVLVRAAAKAVWGYFVTRESCGMRDHREAIKLYGIPGEVLARLGVVERI